MRRLLLLVIPVFLMSISTPALARNMGPAAAKNLMRTAATGTLIGFCAGMTSYGYNNNTTPEIVMMDTIYGFVGGAVLGTGLTVVEFAADRDDIDSTVCRYVAGGAGIGMLMGAFVSLIPYAQKDMRDKRDCANFNEGSIGLGLGGLIGGGLGLGIALMDLSLTTPEKTGENEGEKSLVRGTIGFQTEDALLPPVKEDEVQVPALWCRVVRVEF